ncbi:MAG: 5-(carboxyamino)imidazole ribonucleotide mutase [Pseudomonadota bacterium]|nr:5-(carboxyamino)imidazole ribonucleotide mutase [Pseudomonadota bacterium]MEC8996221.1 5-(carboxyamino)imidazole ribonucleotide mutase [Pseudomonadota bacterium]MED5274436.1 5-(carboxyamino)imidazole ribonucleotide mutase [Pseudomonadota bacterium]MED5430175.1 5-(carboxyamino)imidazole ribonucleotide mutase [Pseudomonadota bacterium]
MTCLVGLIMGSKSDWPTMKHAANMLDKLKIKYESKVVSAHRTPDLLYKYADTADSRGIEVIIAGAGGSAHLPGMTSSKTTLPVIGVPIKTKSLDGVDSLLSIIQMPSGIPVGTVAIGKSGAINSALLAASILSNKYPAIKQQLKKYRSRQTRTVLAIGDPRK